MTSPFAPPTVVPISATFLPTFGIIVFLSFASPMTVNSISLF